MQRIESPFSLTGARITLEPAADAVEPVINEDLAVRLARKEMPGARDATRLTPMFGLFTKRIPGGVSIVQRPAWIVRIEGMCVEPNGSNLITNVPTPYRAMPTARCVVSEWNVVIDATTGKWLLDFSYR